MDINELVAMLGEHRWVAACALVIGAIVRVLKSDTPLPFTVPAKWRGWLAIGLGIVAGALEAVAGGTPWARALAEGLTAALIAITGHELGVESLRGGKELFARQDDGEGEPPRAIERAARITGGMVLAFFVTVLSLGALQGCGYGAATCGAIDVAKTACDVLPIRYLAEDGTERTVLVPRDEVEALGRTAAARAECDGGCADGSAP